MMSAAAEIPPQETDWREDARLEQQEFYSRLGNRKWDFILNTDKTILLRKVAFGMYGPPTRDFNDGENFDQNASTERGTNVENITSVGTNANTSDADTNYGYTNEQMTEVRKMCETIQGLGILRPNRKDIWFACIFVCGKTSAGRFTVPVFKTLKLHTDGVDQDYFIDLNCRVYDGWSDYLNCNTLPPCEYCYPRNGTYTGTDAETETGPAANDSPSDYEENEENFEESQIQVDVDYGMSPASSLPSQVLSTMDTITSCVSFGSAAVFLAGICTVPIAGPIAAAAAVGGLTSGVYAAGRSSFNLHDRRTHGQSIGIYDADARNHWLTVAGGALGFAQASMMTRLAQAAELGQMTGIASRAGRFTFLLVNVGSISVSGIGLASNLFGLLEKYERNELTSLDIVQFSASCLFFSHSLMSFRTAETVIREVQNDVINSRRQELGGRANRNRRYRLNRQHRRNVNANGELAGNAQTVRSINNIRSTQEFYRALTEPETGESEGVYSENMNSNLIASTNRNIIITRTENSNQYEVDPETMQLILATARNLASNLITSEEFHSFMQDLFNRLRPTINAAIARLCEYFHVDKIEDIEVCGYRIFANLRRFEVTKFALFLIDVCTIYRNDIIELVQMITQLRNIHPIENYVDFCRCLVNIVLYVQNQITEYERRYQQGGFNFFSRPELEDLEQRTEFFRERIYRSFRREANEVEANLADFEEIIPRTGMDTNSSEILDDFRSILGVPVSTAESNDSGDSGQLQRPGQTRQVNIYSCFNYNDFDRAASSNGNLSDEQNIRIASEVVGAPLCGDGESSSQVLVNHEDNVTFIYFDSAYTSAYGVKIEKIGSTEHCYGVVTVLFE